jgi:hypothetical protein
LVVDRRAEFDGEGVMLMRAIVVLGIVVVAGCAGRAPAGGGLGERAVRVTVPNGRSPATDHAPRAPMNDTKAMRSGFNHGNGVLWVYLRPGEYVADGVEKDGSLRVKFGWWRGVPGKFWVEGKRVDGPAGPMRSAFEPDGPFGFEPSYLYFPAAGYWEITGHLGGKRLKFVIQVVKGGESDMTGH